MILVVDDEREVRNVVCAILTRAGHETITAEDAPRAIALLQARAPELLLTDIVMPGMSGLALAAQAHHLHPAVPVIFMSGFASQYEGELSGSVCLRKPFTASELLAAVENVLSLKRSR